MRPVLPLHVFPIDQPEVRLIHQRRGLEDVPRPLASHVTGGHPVQLLVDERRQVVHRRLIPVPPGDQQLGDVRRRGVHFEVMLAFLGRNNAFSDEDKRMQAAAMIPVTDALLARCGERAAMYDRENRFFQEDFDELRAAGYLLSPIPAQLGGRGMTLPAVCRQQRRLAYYAPATALGLNMHLYWLGVAADLWRAGDKSLEWMLREAAAGEIFPAGHAESGNDVPVLLSTTN